MSKQIVPLNVDYSSKKEGKSNVIILKLRKEKWNGCFMILLINENDKIRMYSFDKIKMYK